MANPIDVFVTAGQSNADGQGVYQSSQAVAIGLGYMWSGSSIVHLSDPVGPASTGSAWPAFVNNLASRSGVPVCIVPASSSGSGLTVEAKPSLNWSPSGTLAATAISATNAAMVALTTGGWEPVFRGVLWCQGETEAQSYPDQEQLETVYKTELLALHDRFKNALSSEAIMLVFQSGKRVSGDYDEGFVHVREAQSQACKSRIDMVMAYTGCVAFVEQGYMKDDVHYNQTGLNLMGSNAGVIAARFLYTDNTVTMGDASVAYAYAVAADSGGLLPVTYRIGIK